MKELSRDAFISFLYSERDRLFSQHSFAGWNVWAIVGALFGIFWLIIDLIADKTFQTVPLISISVAFLIAGYSLFQALRTSVTHRHTPFKSRYLNSRLKPIDSVFVLTTYCIVVVLLIVNGFWNISRVSLIAFCVFTIIQTIVLFSNLRMHKKGKLRSITVKSGSEGGFEKSFSLLLIAFKFYLLFDLSYVYISKFQVYANEVRLSICIITAYYLVATWILVYGKSELLQRVDAIVDNFVYGNVPQSVTFDRLTICQYGLSLEQAIQNDLDKYLKDQGELDKHVEQFNLICSRFENDCPTEIKELKVFFEENSKALQQELDIIEKLINSNGVFLEKIKNIPTPLSEEERTTRENLFEILNKGLEKACYALESLREFRSKFDEKMTKVISETYAHIAKMAS